MVDKSGFQKGETMNEKVLFEGVLDPETNITKLKCMKCGKKLRVSSAVFLKGTKEQLRESLKHKCKPKQKKEPTP